MASMMAQTLLRGKLTHVDTAFLIGGGPEPMFFGDISCLVAWRVNKAKSS
jgi:hypothetical protein